jgi:hypothetical protein
MIYRFFHIRARPGDRVSFPALAGFMRNENDIPHEQAQPRSRRSCAQQDRSCFEPISGEEMGLDAFVQDAAEG